MTESEKSVRATDIELKDRLVAINRVTKVTKGGRHFSFSAIVVVGDENSIVGHGLGKANEVTEAISKAVEDAKKNLKRVAVVNETLPHAIKSKYSGATGVIAGGAMRAVLESAGIKNVLAKSQGSSNPHNVVKATVNALLSLRDANSVAQQRGVSLDKVFNG